MRKWTILLVTTLFSSFLSQAQNCTEVTVSGRVVDSLQLPAFYNLMIINKSSGKGYFGRPDGSFTFAANNGDSIVLSITGYKSVGFIVNDNQYCTMRITKTIAQLSYQSSDVVVKPIKTLDQLKEERERLAFKETRSITGINVIQSPITALYERFSKKERSKRLVAEMEHQDNINLVLRELLRNYISYDIIDLDEEEFVEFIQFLNISEEFLKTASDYELILFIKDKLEHYKSINNLVPKHTEEEYIYEEK